MTTLFLKFLGGSLLVLCGGGVGWTSACRKREEAYRIETFVRFLQYVQEAVRYRCLPGTVVLTMAAQHREFAEFCPDTLPATVYKGNIIKNLIMDCQSYTKYRPNETTGGIFVSWRRKEELPTGA